MPQFGHQDGFDTVSLITGPSHVLLGIRFADAASAAIELIKRPQVGTCDHGPLDEARIAESIQAGIAAANAETGARHSAAQAFYVENDSPRYELYERCAYLLASRRARAAE
jgi:hypothetical protein